MTRFRVIVAPAADKELAAVRDRVLKTRLTRAIAALAENPRPQGVKKLMGGEGEWRIRVGTWRIVYRVEDEVLVVLVVRIAPRSGVYR